MAFDEFPDDFKLITAMQNAKARAEDAARLQDVIAGRETGHGNRHNRRDDPRNMNAARRRAAEATHLDMLLASDPEYAALYRDFGDLLSDAESRTEAALAKAESALADTMDKAARLPDGRTVFMDENGNVVTEDGEIIDPEIAAGIEWPNDAPSYEEYRTRKDEVDALRRYQVDVLGTARGRYEDPDNPMTRDEFEDWEQRIQDETPAAIKLKPESALQDEALELSTTIEVAKPAI